MSHFIIKLVKFALWGIVLLFVTSHGAPAVPGDAGLPYDGAYLLRADGETTLLLEGQGVYEKVEESWGDGSQAMLKLHLSNTCADSPHYLGIFIARPKKEAPLTIGSTYKINGEIQGFLSNFEGVFGFASINALGEQPFFAKKGSLTIGHIGEGVLRGTLALSLTNVQGKTIGLNGGFSAVRK